MSTMFSEEVIFIDVSGHESAAVRWFDLACAFCGLSVKRLFVEDLLAESAEVIHTDREKMLLICHFYVFLHLNRFLKK